MKIFNIKCYIVVIAAIVFVLVASYIRYKPEDVNYYNADATWHTLLTIEAYNETPIAQHIFLPIVSLGDESDKWIPWGATINDNQGNYYYTSFSPAGYFLPWLFIKTFNLPVCEHSLYIFNTLLFMFSAVLWSIFLKWIYSKNEIVILGVLLYVFVPEMLHGMGIVYWHQSVFQVTFIAQIMAYYRYKKDESKRWGILFFVLVFINPYIEWSGYIANMGFFIFELFHIRKQRLLFCLRRLCLIGILTVTSVIVFIAHYLSRVNKHILFETIKARFMARNVTTVTELSSVIGGYFKSFSYIWIVLFVLVIWNIWRNKKLEILNGSIIFLVLFPLLENVVMKEHAYFYSYDRMKGILFVSLLCCEFMRQLFDGYATRKKVISIMASITILCCINNIYEYSRSGKYLWQADYRKGNIVLAEYIKENYANSILGLNDAPVRGYVNLLFSRGVYEWKSFDWLSQKALEEGMQYVIIINIENSESLNMYDLSGATVYDVKNETVTNIYEKDSEIIIENN